LREEYGFLHSGAGPVISKPEQSIKDPAAHIDILPTLLEICNIPADEQQLFDGHQSLGSAEWFRQILP
jgi:arylsulfatase A-like enzyme